METGTWRCIPGTTAASAFVRIGRDWCAAGDAGVTGDPVVYCRNALRRVRVLSLGFIQEMMCLFTVRTSYI